MNRSLLFRSVVAKDLKTLLRDRQQLFAVVVGLVSAVVTVASLELTIRFENAKKLTKTAKAPMAKTEGEGKLDAGAGGKAEAPSGGPASAPEGIAPVNALGKAGPSVPLWIVIVCGTGVGWYAALFMLPLGFATFAGERERGTLEVILATPVPDATLYAFKSLSVTVPGVGYGGMLLLLSLAYALGFHPEMTRLVSAGEVLLGTLLSMPFLVMLCGIHVALGACCSVRAKTTQGAGMLFAGIITAAFLLITGAGAVLFLTPAEGPALEALLWFLRLPFVLQYLIVAAVFASAWAALFLIGKALFVREKMLLA
jgi:hypothetical protein